MSSLLDIILSVPYPVIEQWGYVALFVASTLEALPIVGSMVPGQTVVMLGGFFAQLEILRLPVVMLAASAGAIAGDVIGFWIGRHYGYAFIERHGTRFFFKPEYIEKTKTLMRDHTGKALVIGRFNPITRAFGPFVAGWSRVRFRTFFFYNVLGGIGWGVGCALIGFIFGSSFQVISRYVGRFFLLAILAGVLIIFGYRWLNKRRHIWERYHGYLICLNILALGLFGKMLEDVFRHDAIVLTDLGIWERMMAWWSPALNQVMIAITHIMSPSVGMVLAILLVAYLLYRKRFSQAGLVVTAELAGLLSHAMLKHVVARARPPIALVAEQTFSFPSGHATMAAIFFTLLYFSLRDDLSKRWQRRVLLIGAIGFSLLIGISRIYLGAHWMSDVLAGWALGFFIVTLSILLFRVLGSIRQKT